MNKLNEPKEPANSVCFEHNWNRTANMGECPKCYRAKRSLTNKASGDLDSLDFIVEHIWQHGNNLGKFPNAWKSPDEEKEGEVRYAKKFISDLIANQVAEARIDELRKFVDSSAYAKYGDGVTAHFRGGAFIPVEDILKRLANLKGKET